MQGSVPGVRINMPWKYVGYVFLALLCGYALGGLFGWTAFLGWGHFRGGTQSSFLDFDGVAFTGVCAAAGFGGGVTLCIWGLLKRERGKSKVG